jgi:predicted MPP superfamily phosphohydrolase
MKYKSNNSKPHKGLKIIIPAAAAAAVIAALAVYLWCGVNLLQITHYTVTSSKLPKSFDGYKIVQLTDLHSITFGSDNKRLIDKINGLKPDLIVVTGDMMNSENDNGQVFEKLAAVLVKKYPVYCISGNHEEKVQQHPSNHIFANFKSKLLAMGVKYIDNEKVQISRGRSSISLYGLTMPLSYYSSQSDIVNNGYYLSRDRITQRIGNPDKAQFNILLVHSPYFFSSYAEWGADLSFAGHLHGGVIRLPFLGGVISPDLTLFPKYDAGLFKKGGSEMIVGRGLGTSIVSIRILDQPEIVDVTLKAA